jgi:hypothetical protein
MEHYDVMIEAFGRLGAFTKKGRCFDVMELRIGRGNCVCITRLMIPITTQNSVARISHQAISVLGQAASDGLSIIYRIGAGYTP